MFVIIVAGEMPAVKPKMPFPGAPASFLTNGVPFVGSSYFRLYDEVRAMIDPKLLRDDMDYVRKVLRLRNMEGVVDLDALRNIDGERRAAIAKADELREKRNRVSKEIGKRKAGGGDAAGLMAEMEGVNEELAREAMRLAAQKLPIKTKFVTRKEQEGGLI